MAERLKLNGDVIIDRGPIANSSLMRDEGLLLDRIYL